MATTISEWDEMNDRVDQLSKRLFGRKKTSCDDSDLTAKLQTASDALSAKAKSVSDVHAVWEKLELLERLTSIDAIADVGTSALTTQAKAEIVMAGETSLNQLASRFKKLKGLEGFANTQNITDISKETKKLLPIASVAVEQQEEFEDFNERVTELLDSYNKITSALSKKFLYWDEVLSAAEAKLSPKTSDE